VLTVLVLVVGTLAVVTSERSSRLSVGFNDASSPANYSLQTKLGAPIRRLLIGWNQVERTPGSWDWTEVDAAYHGLLAAHLRPLLLAVAPPCWSHPRVPCVGADTGSTPPDPMYDDRWAEFIGKLASRYPKALGIEVWNEENLAAEFTPHPDPVRYTQLLAKAYRAVKRAVPDMPVISGGLFASAVSGPAGVGDAQFLAAMYAAGARRYMDGIGIHSYAVIATTNGAPAHYDVGAVEQTLDRIRVARARARGDGTPIWITETGVPTAAGQGSPVAASEAQQAADLLAIIRLVERDDDIRVLIIHRLVDPPRESSGAIGSEPGYGVFRSDGAPKLAACELSAQLHGSLRCQRAETPP
jgi:hypothetical protein